jgi:tetratricopeptide (TPR) repeat protein
MAERFLFTPSLGFCYAVGVFAAHLGRWAYGVVSGRRMSWMVPAIFTICIVLGVRTISRAADWKNDLTLFTTDVTTSPNSARGHAFLGIAYRKSGENLQKGEQQTELFQKAIAHYRKSLEILPPQWDIWHELGYAYYLAEDYEEALKAYRRALEYEPKSEKVHASLGTTYYKLATRTQQGEQQTELFQKAIAHYRKSLEISPGQWAAWHDLGHIYYLIGDYDESLKDYQRALECDPNRSRTYVNIGTIAFSRKEYGRAIECFKTAVRLDSSNADAYADLGAVYHQIGKYKDALAGYEKALQLNPRFEAVRRNLELLKSPSGAGK